MARLREQRDGVAADQALAVLERAAAGDDNLMPPIVAAVDAGATLGEICGALRRVFGEYRPASAAAI